MKMLAELIKIISQLSDEFPIITRREKRLTNVWSIDKKITSYLFPFFPSLGYCVIGLLRENKEIFSKKSPTNHFYYPGKRLTEVDKFNKDIADIYEPYL